MKSLLSSRPVLWSLFLFNLLVALVTGLAMDSAQGRVTSVSMGLVALGAGAGLYRSRARQT